MGLLGLNLLPFLTLKSRTRKFAQYLKKSIGLSQVATPPSTSNATRLEVHLLGGSMGESVVIKLPTNEWGVIDCYSCSLTDASLNPTVQFLRKRGVTSLLFVC